MAKPKDKSKQLKRLYKHLSAHLGNKKGVGARPSTRPGRYNPFDPEEPMKDNGTVILTDRGRIEKKIQTLENTKK